MNSNLLKHVFKPTFHKAVLPAAMLGLALTAQAEEAPVPSYSIAYNVGALSDYRVRGIAQTGGNPAIQGGIDLTTKSGLYLGTAASNVNWVQDFNGATKGSYELDLYGGYRALITDTDYSYDVGVITYQYPGNDSGVGGAFPEGTYGNASTIEVYADLLYSIYTLKYNRSQGNFLGNLNSSGSQYFDLSAAIDMTHSFTLTPHIGHQYVTGQNGSLDYTDYSLTLSKDFGNGLSATLAGIATTASTSGYTDTKGRYLGNSTAVAGLRYTF
jgi:uncharacterized protein (TIGR02001 family)